jgi:hypothetical protein
MTDDDRPTDPPDETEYLLMESVDGLIIEERCMRDLHRVERDDGVFTCIDCDLEQDLSDDGAQMKLPEGDQ